jgi:hypothetical protein
MTARRVVHNLVVLHFRVPHPEVMNNIGNGIRAPRPQIPKLSVEISADVTK